MYNNWDNLTVVKSMQKKRKGGLLSTECHVEQVCLASTTLPLNGSVAQLLLSGFVGI